MQRPFETVIRLYSGCIDDVGKDIQIPFATLFY